jgi:hypothetical protein
MLSCNDQISADKVLKPLYSFFYDFSYNNDGRGFCWVFIRCSQYTEHCTTSLLNEMNSKFQDQLIKNLRVS